MIMIAAIDQNNAIGFNGNILERIDEDMKRFKRITTGNVIIMGRKTFESLPNGSLKNRINIVITKNRSYKASNALIIYSKEELMNILKLFHSGVQIYVIGGAEIYKLLEEECDILYITHIHKKYENADTYFPININEWHSSICSNIKIDEVTGIEYHYENYIKE